MIVREPCDCILLVFFSFLRECTYHFAITLGLPCAPIRPNHSQYVAASFSSLVVAAGMFLKSRH